MLLTLISSLVSRLVKDPLTQSIIMLFIAQCYEYGSRMAGPALQYIKEAAGLPITNTERFEYVVDRLKKDYPDAKGDFIRTVVQATFTKWADSFK